MAYTANDSYCAETDVEAIVGLAISVTSTPTTAQVLEFMAHRSAEVYAVMRQIMGASAPGPASYDVTMDTSTDVGKMLNARAVALNAIGAAIDTLQAAGATQTPARSERVTELMVDYDRALEMLMLAAKEYLGVTYTSANHISEGEITEASVTSKEETGFTFDTDTKF